MLIRCLDFLREEQGATAVEYAVMLALILSVLISAISAVGISNGSLWNNSQSKMIEFGLGR